MRKLCYSDLIFDCEIWHFCWKVCRIGDKCGIHQVLLKVVYPKSAAFLTEILIKKSVVSLTKIWYLSTDKILPDFLNNFCLKKEDDRRFFKKFGLKSRGLCSLCKYLSWKLLPVSQLVCLKIKHCRSSNLLTWSGRAFKIGLL